MGEVSSILQTSTEGCVDDMLCITFNDQRETFFPGQEINGSLNLNLTAEIQISSKMFQKSRYDIC